jgi:Ca-activated chloride channel family protein
MTTLARKSDGNSGFAENSTDLVRLFKAEFGDVLAVAAQEVTIRIECGDGIRPVRVLGREADISGDTVRVQMNQLYSGQEKYVLLEVEVPATRAGKSRELATVTVTYANMATRAVDKLTSTVSVGFTDSLAKADDSVNRDVMEAAVLQVATERNKLATDLRDQGKADEARVILVSNGAYLKTNGERYKSKLLIQYSIDNDSDAKNLDEVNWARQRKDMRSYQEQNVHQRSYR